MKRKRCLKFKQTLKENNNKQKTNIGEQTAGKIINMYYRLADEGISPAKLGNL